MVHGYYVAVDRGELYYAWADLGGRNLVPSWEKFQAGYGDTKSVICDVDSVEGDRVKVQVIALHADGTWHIYDGAYTVSGSEITAGSLRQILPAPPG